LTGGLEQVESEAVEALGPVRGTNVGFTVAEAFAIYRELIQ
jgi:hypothetical protein